ncbi:MAG: metal-dependent hydrolase [Blastocatellia bacterium]|nr:metal-dependent hydrolase [Blastocatellia bacterium]
MMGACVVAALSRERRPERLWPFLVLGGFLGVFPDLDYLLTVYRWMGRDWHHGVTHSILFAFVVGGLAAWFARMRGLRGWLTFSLATLSHPLLDYVYTESRGVELFWPFSRGRHRLGVMPPLGYDWRRETLLEMANDIVTLCAFELAVGASLMMLILMAREAFSSDPRS